MLASLGRLSAGTFTGPQEPSPASRQLYPPGGVCTHPRASAPAPGPLRPPEGTYAPPGSLPAYVRSPMRHCLAAPGLLPPLKEGKRLIGEQDVGQYILLLDDVALDVLLGSFKTRLQEIGWPDC